MKENQKIKEYKWKRDTWQKRGNIAVAAYYQILIVHEIEDSGFCFHRKGDAKQQKYILHDMLDEILGTDDVNYHNGIFHEVLLSGSGSRLSGVEKECRICGSFFENSGVSEYVWGVYQLHLGIILEIAREDMEKAELYAGNLLTLLDIRYGMENREYARMKLHIVGEYYFYFDRESFYTEFESNYEYFKQYVAECDIFFCDMVLFYVNHLVENGMEGQELWVERSETEAERWRESEYYGTYKCKSVWLRAKMLEKRNQDEEALKLLQELITDYIEKNRSDKTSFYGPVYLLAAAICRKNHEEHQMLYYARQGLAICEELGQTYSEWYYNLYNCVGIWYISQHNWGEAEKLYGESLQQIERKFGKENENYILYLNNLATVAMNQGKDALPYYEEFERIKSERFGKKYGYVFCNMLYILITSGVRLEEIEKTYKFYIKYVGEQDRPQLDTYYMGAKASGAKFDEEFCSLAQKLRSRYQGGYTEKLAIMYWNSILIWQWKTGGIDTAFQISKNLMRQIENTKDGKWISIIINHIQLLVLNGQYDEAERRILPMLDWLYDCMLDTGCGSISRYLVNMRILLSIYIHSLKRGGECVQLDQETQKLLLERIICCKTIEREMKGLLGKYDKDEQIELRRYKELHRKLAALEILGKGGPDTKGYVEEERFREKEIICLSEQEEYAASVNQEIAFHDKVHQYRLEEINIPYDFVCVEYFAYYHFYSDTPMSGVEIENVVCNFLAFILQEEGGQVRITGIEDIKDISLEAIIENELNDLEEGTKFSENEEERNKKALDAIQRLRQLFAEPVLKYFDTPQKMYLGLDFILQLLPMDLLFYDSKEEPLHVIMVESVRYVGEDSGISFEGANALVIGNPQISYLDEKNGRLSCGELESMEIARMLETKAYVGKEAKQKLLWGKESRTMIHICAHGDLLEESGDRILQSNLFTNSFLKLAGYIDWKEGCKLRDYGSGVLSGDDFLFMDLSKTRLVVLSACASGLGYSKGLQAIHGMRWAISAAGAENSVTTLWEISDEAGGILMIMFYRNLRSMSVSEALYQAKKCLRTITVEELRKDPVLWSIVETGGKRYGAKERPYSHWRNWAAFVHYHR